MQKVSPGRAHAATPALHLFQSGLPLTCEAALCRIRYTVSLQAVLAPGDQVENVLLVGSVQNDTGERPVIAYLFGVESLSLYNQTATGVVSLHHSYLLLPQKLLITPFQPHHSPCCEIPPDWR